MSNRDLPRCDSLGKFENEKYIFTHADWRTEDLYGNEHSWPETLVWFKPLDRVDTVMVQHGIRNLEYVTPLLVRMMDKGWTPYKIQKTFDFIRERKWHLKKATVL
jgi:hypothetical protein